jgi:signal transduction histidine kinase
MIKKIINILSKTKIAFIGLLLVLIPVIILSYNNYKAIPEKSAVLKSSFDLSVTLMHNNIERELLNYQESLVKQTERLPIENDRYRIIAALKAFEKDNPLVSNSFLVKENGYIVSAMASNGWKMYSVPLAAINPQFSEEIKAAEEEEFVKENPGEAISVYSRILLYSSPGGLNLYNSDVNKKRPSGSADSIFILSRIGRCYYKLKQYSLAIKYYKKIVEIDKGIYTLAGLPVTVAALQEISDSYREMKDAANYYSTQLKLFNYLYNNPRDPIDEGYKKLLRAARMELEKSSSPGIAKNPEELERDLLNNERYLLLVKKVFNEKGLFHNSENNDGLQLFHLNAAPDTNIYYYNLEMGADKSSVIFGFTLNTAKLLNQIIPELLKRIKPDDDVIFTIRDNRQNVIYTSNPSTNGAYNSGYLSSRTMSGIAAGWQILLSDREGKTITQLAEENKTGALLLLGGAVLVTLAGIIIIIRSAVKELELSQMKTDFVSNVSHELKTPLSMIRMFSETLDSDINMNESQRKEFTHIIKKESERLSQLVNNILDFSRIEQDKRKYNIERADLAALVKSITDIYRAQLCEKGFKFTVQLPYGEVISCIDKEAISRVIINLLNNAEKYSDNNKEIIVKLLANADTAEIIVEDRGIGIPGGDLERIFDRFYRSSNSEKLAAGGTGLGLTIAKNIVRAHHGKIEVLSTENKGSCFFVFLPLMSADKRGI